MLYSDDVEVKVVKAEEPTTTPEDPTTPNPTTQNPTTQNPTGAPGTSAPGAGTPGAATTAKPITTVEDAFEAIDTLAEAIAVAAKLDESAFASKDDYNAFQAVLAAARKVANNDKATQAEKDKALADLKAAMEKYFGKNSGNDKGRTKFLAAAKEVLEAANSSGTETGGKTGDSAPVAVLMLVAIAAFGTAVVVYRKKVNA